MSWKGGKRRTSIEDRLERYSIPEPNSGCMLWLGSTDGKGYPKLAVGRKFRLVSHLILERAGRSVPKGLCACHRCDNPHCIEETHLFVGSQKDNIRDMMKKGRHRWQVIKRDCSVASVESELKSSPSDARQGNDSEDACSTS